MRFLLKYKLFLLLMLVPLLALSVYFMVAKSVFEKDKLAYIYDANIRASQNISQKINSKVQYLSLYTKTLLTSFNMKSMSIDGFTKQTFERLPEIYSLKVYKLSEGQLSLIDRIDKVEHSEANKDLLESWNSENSLELGNIDAEKETIQLNYLSRNNNVVFETVVHAPEFFEHFSDNPQFSYFLVEPSGNIKFKSGQTADFPGNFKEWSKFSDISKNLVGSGATEYNSKKAESTYLASYAEVELGNIKVFSFIDKNIAYSAINLLVKKSFLFLICVFSLTVLIGILGSLKLTQSIAKLHDATQEIESGNYNVEVDVRTNDEMGDLAQSFTGMSSRIHNLMTELEKYNRSLEVLVEERTTELNKAMNLQKALLDSLGQGFFMFDGEGEVLPVYSKVSVDMFGREPSGEFVGDLLSIDDKQKTLLKKLCQYFIDEPMPFEDVAAAAPSSFVNKDNRNIFIDYTPIRNAENKVTGTVLVATDKTEELKAIEQSNKEKKYVDMILKILESKKQFSNFLVHTKSLLDELGKTVKQSGVTGDTLEVFFRYVHSIKGHCYYFDIVNIGDLLHTKEDQLEVFQADISAVKKADLLAILDEVNAEFSDFLSKNSHVTGAGDWNKLEPKLSVSSKVMEEIRNKLAQGDVKSAVKALDNNVLNPSFNEVINYYSNVAYEQAKKQGKKMIPTNIESSGVDINTNSFGEVFPSLINVFKNIVDHGIEKPSQRKKLNKPVEGQIKVAAEIVDKGKGSHLRLVISDDGKGMNKEVQENIFKDGFSTAESVGKTAGRGVGMSAVLHAVKQANGELKVDSKLGEGSSFIIELPMKKSA